MNLPLGAEGLLSDDQIPVEKEYWVGLNMVLGVGKTLFHRLLKRFETPKCVFKAKRGELMEVEGIGPKTANEILAFDFDSQVQREFRMAKKLGAEICTLDCKEYPEALKNIYDPPPVLYFMGESLNHFPISISVVGARTPSNYGIKVTEFLCSRLADRNICIVSGMARGIDTTAHRQALASGGKTLAVFGNGLAHTYPPENFSLRKKIQENGAVISEFALSVKPDRNNFPARNRVISGLSLGTIIVEAGEKSGALITAQFALEQSREVFAVPGSIFSSKSVGTHRLLKMGAKLVDGVESILEELPQIQETGNFAQNPESEKEIAISDSESRILSLLKEEDRHIDTLIEQSGLNPSEVSATLVEMELRGLVNQRNGKMFSSNIGI